MTSTTFLFGLFLICTSHGSTIFFNVGIEEQPGYVSYGVRGVSWPYITAQELSCDPSSVFYLKPCDGIHSLYVSNPSNSVDSRSAILQFYAERYLSDSTEALGWNGYFQLCLSVNSCLPLTYPTEGPVSGLLISAIGGPFSFLNWTGRSISKRVDVIGPDFIQYCFSCTYGCSSNLKKAVEFGTDNAESVLSAIFLDLFTDDSFNGAYAVYDLTIRSTSLEGSNVDEPWQIQVFEKGSYTLSSSLSTSKSAASVKLEITVFKDESMEETYSLSIVDSGSSGNPKNPIDYTAIGGYLVFGVFLSSFFFFCIRRWFKIHRADDRVPLIVENPHQGELDLDENEIGPEKLDPSRVPPPAPTDFGYQV